MLHVMLAEAPVLMGCPTPRIESVPEGDPARGDEAIVFATDELRVDLMDWQRYVLRAACRTTPTDTWAARTVLVLVARQQGKSFLTACRILAGLWCWGERLAIASASSRDIALELFRTTLEMAEEADLPIERVRKAIGSEEVIFTNGSRYKVVSATSRGSRGLSCDLAVIDELREHKTFEAYDGIEKTRRSRPSSQAWCISSEGDFQSAVLDLLAGQGRAAAEAGVPGPLCFLEWSAAPALDRADPRGWAQANPALGITLTREVIEAELVSDLGTTFERECLNRRVAVARPWLPSGTWDRCGDADASVSDDAVGEVVFALDASPDFQASIAVGWRRPDGRIHVELVTVSDSTWGAEHVLRGLIERWRPRCLSIVGRGPAEPVGARLAADGVELQALSNVDVDRASRAFYEASASGSLVHPLDPVLAASVESVQGSGGLLSLKATGLNITGAVAAVLAHWAAARTPVVKIPTWIAY